MKLRVGSYYSLSVVILFLLASCAPRSNDDSPKKENLCVISPSDQILLNSLELPIDTEGFLAASSDCSNSYLSQLLHTLSEFKKVQFKSIPSHLDNEVTQKLKNPWQYFVGQKLTGISFDEASRASAGYSLDTGRLLVPKALLIRPLSVQMAIMIHEATHSVPGLPWHSNCYQGQLMGVAGCDDALEARAEYAGSYSVEYWFLRLVASSDGTRLFTETEKNHSLAEARKLVAHRFNHVFEHAQFNDVMVVTDTNNQIKVYDPLFKQLASLKGLENAAPRIRKISKNHSNHGFYIHTKDNHLLAWDPTTHLIEDFRRSPLGAHQGNIKEVFRIFHPELQANRNLLIGADTNMLLEGLNEQQDRDYLSFDTVSNIKSFDALHGRNLMMLDTKGDVHFYSSQLKELQFPVMGLPKNIQSVSPNQYGFSFYAIDDQGQVHFGKLHREEEIPVEFSVTHLTFEKDDFQALQGKKAKKISDGIGYRGLLDDSGVVTLKTYHKYMKVRAQSFEPQKEFPLTLDRPIKDFLFVKSTKFKDQTLSQEGPNIKNFEKECNVTVTDKEPWLQRLVGITSSGEVIVWDANQCRTLVKNVSEFRFVDSGISKNPFGYNQTHVYLKTKSGEEKVISPMLENIN